LQPPLRPAAGAVSVLNPTLRIGDVVHWGPCSALAAIPLAPLDEVIGSAFDQADAVTDELDAILRGHPIGRQAL
jgi:hypothetical protein